MQEFARELISLTVALSRIYAAERPSASGSNRWYSPLSSVLSCLRPRAKKSEEEESRTTGNTRRPRGLHRRICAFRRSTQTHADLSGALITAGMLTRGKSRIAYSFPKVRPHAPDTVQTPSRTGLSPWRRFQLSLWTFGGRLQDHDVKYAVKTGMATAVLAAPAFFDATRPTFMEYRGEWALISVSGLGFGVRAYVRACVSLS